MRRASLIGLLTAITCWSSITLVQTSFAEDALYATGKSLSAGDGFICAINVEGGVGCLGRNDRNLDVPDLLGRVTQITSGLDHTCALNESGAVTCWGLDEYGQITVPSDLGTTTQISGRFNHICGLNESGAVKCWGLNEYGQTDVPSDLGITTQISAGGNHTCALDILGKVACWGDNQNGQTVVPQGLADVYQLESGYKHVCALKTTGLVSCWGAKHDGGDASLTVPSNLGVVTQISAGAGVTCALNNLGKVNCWSVDGSLQYKPAAGAGIEFVTQIDSGCLVDRYGEVTCSESSNSWSNPAFGKVLSLPPSSISPPEIRGIPVSGATLTAQNNNLNPDAHVIYEWLRDGRAVHTATTPTYRLQKADLGRTVEVRVTALSSQNLPAVEVSQLIIPKSLTASGSPCSSLGVAQVNLGSNWNSPGKQPYITGKPQFGQTLNGFTNNWTKGTKFCSFWISGDKAIKGTSKNTYTLQGSDYGKEIRFLVVGTISGKPSFRISNPVVVSKAVFENAKEPSVIGGWRFGSTLRGRPPTWQAGTTFTYRWIKWGNSPRPAVLSTKINYTPKIEDIGETLNFETCGSKAFYVTLCMSSMGEEVLPAKITKVGKISVIGKNKSPGSILAGTTTDWMSGVELQTQWLLNGKSIKGTNNSQTIEIKAGHRGKVLSYQVTGFRNGYETITRTSSGVKIP